MSGEHNLPRTQALRYWRANPSLCAHVLWILEQTGKPMTAQALLVERRYKGRIGNASAIDDACRILAGLGQAELVSAGPPAEWRFKRRTAK
jgi:hypothetical protein